MCIEGGAMMMPFVPRNSSLACRGLALAFSGSRPFTEWISSIAGFFSLRPAGRLRPVT